MRSNWSLWPVLSSLLGAGAQVAASSTSISVSASPNPAVFGAPVTLTAIVSPSVANGAVTFYDGATILGTSNLSSGSAFLIVRLTNTGIRRIFARCNGAASAPVSVTVKTVPASSFSPTIISGVWNNHEVAIGDFNGDGIPDIVTAAFGSIFVFPGDGHGNFGAPIQTISSASQGDTLYIATGDFNRDGRLDLAMINGTPQQPQNLIVWFGRGDGTFALGPVINIGGTSLAVADFNGDGFADLAVGMGPTPGVTVFLSNGDGTFHTPAVYSLTGGPFGVLVTAADLNQDGNPDLVALTAVVNPPGDHNRVSVLLGRGDGTFLQPAGWVDDSVIDSNAQGSLAIGDLNGDGIPEVVVQDGFAYASYRCSVTAMTGYGDGTFQLPETFLCSNTSPTSANGSSAGTFIADVDGDGRADVASIDIYDEAFVQLMLGDGDGTLQAASVFPFPNTIYASASSWAPPVALADFNGDGRIDFATGSLDGIVIFEGGTGPLLRISQTHAGTIVSGQSETYAVTVSNDTGASTTNGKVSVTDHPGDLYSGITSMAGQGWLCDEGTWTCTRDDPLTAGGSYPPIVVQIQVDVPFGAPPIQTNRAVVSGGGSPSAESNLTDPALPAGSVSTITSVSTVYTADTSLAAISPNDWIEIHGINLVPASTPASGVTWSSANFALGHADSTRWCDGHDKWQAGIRRILLQRRFQRLRNGPDQRAESFGFYGAICQRYSDKQRRHNVSLSDEHGGGFTCIFAIRWHALRDCDARGLQLNRTDGPLPWVFHTRKAGRNRASLGGGIWFALRESDARIGDTVR